MHKYKINYVIATWAGHRLQPQVNNQYYETVLQKHLNFLYETRNSLSQITIMRPKCSTLNNYYDIDFKDNVVIIDCENKYQSYGQWMLAATKFLDDFDYFIFIEDDYIPGCDNFDLALLDEYEEDSYLCSLVGGKDDTFHCAISNGMISSKSLKKVLENTDYVSWFDEYAIKYPQHIDLGSNYQIVFSRYLYDNGIKLVDYSEQYGVLYHVKNHNIKAFSLKEPHLIEPIQKRY
jgi:hypothetical protein